MQYPYDRERPLGYMQGGGYVLSLPLVEAIVHKIRSARGGEGGRYLYTPHSG
jgi:hypothetical protein